MQEHGGDIYSHEGMLDFSANINPLGPGEKVTEALEKSLGQVTAYPDPKCRALREQRPDGNLRIQGRSSAEMERRI